MKETRIFGVWVDIFNTKLFGFFLERVKTPDTGQTIKGLKIPTKLDFSVKPNKVQTYENNPLAKHQQTYSSTYIK